MAVAWDEVALSVRPARPRVAVVTVVRGEHRGLLAQVDGLATSRGRPTCTSPSRSPTGS